MPGGDEAPERPSLVRLSLNPTAEGPLSKSLVVLKIFEQGNGVFYVLVTDGGLFQSVMPLWSARVYGRHLTIGEHTYKELKFGMYDENTFSDQFGGKEAVEKMFMKFDDIRVYQDVELIALASLFTAGNVINKIRRLPLSSVQVARIKS